MTAGGGLLERLVAEARAETGARRARVAQAELERRAASAPPPPAFTPALRGERLAVIAEMKARTPIMGTLAQDYRPADLARRYERAGAAAISVLCQATSFGGSPEHLAEARSACALPLLRKDFVSDEYQLLEARALGASAVLLIVAALPDPRLRALHRYARELDLAVLVEAHDEAEVRRALALEPELVGVNHRDLDTFAVDLALTERLRRLVPPEVVYVAESGIRSAADARRVREAGADAILVGEALMRAADPATVVRELAG